MTIKDLSVQTGYSVGTISRVLNNHPNVSDKARKVILEAAEACGFQLNTNAQQLKQQRSQNILVLVKGSSNQLFGSLVEAIQRRVAGSPFHLVVDYMDEDNNEVLRALQLCREKKPLGLLFLGGNKSNFLADFDRIDVPCVLVTSDGSELPFRNLSSVCCNEDLAVKDTIEHLIQLGHRRIGIIGGHRERSDTAQRRFEGCQAAFRAHDIPFNPELDYASTRFSYLGGYRAAQLLFSRGLNYTAIFCMADVMAMGAIRALTDSGLRVPEDVSVVGFDGLPIGEFIVPRLATVSQDIETLAQRSIELLRQSFDTDLDPIHEVIPAQIQWKESARPV
ncbi:MAG: LacI family DNA-binding transcriptional regulator [Oscillospiraceae bacterium]|nr:LacI family DNA-binding transcriptional regulator [Oscillospiraceae bacterium]